MTPKRKKILVWLSVPVLVLGSGAWYAYSHALILMENLRDVRLEIAGFSSQTFETDSVRLHYLRGGSGKKTVLLIHGFGLGGATTWFDSMLALEEDVNLVVPDLLWFGRSEGDIAPNLPNQAKTLWALCDHLRLRPDAIVGVSYGGFVAFEMLHQRPEGTRQLLLINSPGPVFREDDVAELCERAQVKSPDELFIPTDVPGLHRLFEFVFSGKPPVPDFIYDQIFELETTRNADVKRRLMRDLVNNAPIYRQVGFPRTKNCVVWGKKDQVFPLEIGRELADSLHAEMYVLEESGHVPNPKERAVYLDLLRKILKD